MQPPVRNVIAGLSAVAALIIGTLIYLIATPTTEKIVGYDSCVAAGGQVITSYPARCIAPDGRMFTQTIR